MNQRIAFKDGTISDFGATRQAANFDFNGSGFEMPTYSSIPSMSDFDSFSSDSKANTEIRKGDAKYAKFTGGVIPQRLEKLLQEDEIKAVREILSHSKVFGKEGSRSTSEKEEYLKTKRAILNLFDLYKDQSNFDEIIASIRREFKNNPEYSNEGVNPVDKVLEEVFNGMGATKYTKRDDNGKKLEGESSCSFYTKGTTPDVIDLIRYIKESKETKKAFAKACGELDNGIDGDNKAVYDQKKTDGIWRPFNGAVDTGIKQRDFVHGATVIASGVCQKIAGSIDLSEINAAKGLANGTQIAQSTDQWSSVRGGYSTTPNTGSTTAQATTSTTKVASSGFFKKTFAKCFTEIPWISNLGKAANGYKGFFGGLKCFGGTTLKLGLRAFGLSNPVGLAINGILLGWDMGSLIYQYSTRESKDVDHWMVNLARGTGSVLGNLGFNKGFISA